MLAISLIFSPIDQTKRTEAADQIIDLGTVCNGEYKVDLQADVGGSGTKTDVLFVLDTTGSMGPVISAAKSGGTQLMNSLKSKYGENIQFGVAWVNDNPAPVAQHFYVVAGMTSNAATVQGGINSLEAGNPSYGSDREEAYNTAYFYASRNTDSSGGMVGWRSGSRKIIIMLLDNRWHGSETDNKAADYSGVTKNQAISEINNSKLSTGVVVYPSAGAPWAVTVRRDWADKYLNLLTGSRGLAVLSSDAELISEIEQLVEDIISSYKKIDAAADPDKYSSWVNQTARENVVIPDGGLSISYPVTIKPQESGPHAFTLSLQGDGEVFKTYEIKLNNDCSAKPGAAGMLKETFSDSTRATKEATFEKGQKVYVQISIFLREAKSGVNIYDYVTQVKPRSAANFKLIQSGTQSDVTRTESISFDGSGTITFGPMDLTSGENRIWYEYIVAD